MKRDFTYNGKKFTIVNSNKSDFKYQGMIISNNTTRLLNVYGNTLAEVKENIQDKEDFNSRIEADMEK